MKAYEFGNLAFEKKTSSKQTVRFSNIRMILINCYRDCYVICEYIYIIRPCEQ